MRCRSVTGFLHCWQHGYSCTSLRDGTHALHGPQCLQGITMYSALCALQRGHDGSARAVARPGTGCGTCACQTSRIGLAGDPPGAIWQAIGGRNGRGAFGLGAAAAGGGQHAPARPAVPAVSGEVGEHSKRAADDWACPQAAEHARILPPLYNAGCGLHWSKRKIAWVRRDSERSERHAIRPSNMGGMPEAALGTGDEGSAGVAAGGGEAAAAGPSAGSSPARRVAKPWELALDGGDDAGAAGCTHAGASWTVVASLGSTLAGSASGDLACMPRRSLACRLRWQCLLSLKWQDAGATSWDNPGQQYSASPAYLGWLACICRLQRQWSWDGRMLGAARS